MILYVGIHDLEKDIWFDYTFTPDSSSISLSAFSSYVSPYKLFTSHCLPKATTPPKQGSQYPGQYRLMDVRLWMNNLLVLFWSKKMYVALCASYSRLIVALSAQPDYLDAQTYNIVLEINDDDLFGIFMYLCFEYGLGIHIFKIKNIFQNLYQLWGTWCCS